MYTVRWTYRGSEHCGEKLVRAGDVAKDFARELKREGRSRIWVHVECASEVGPPRTVITDEALARELGVQRHECCGCGELCDSGEPCPMAYNCNCRFVGG